MSLTKDDLTQIKEIVQGVVGQSELNIRHDFTKTIKETESNIRRDVAETIKDTESSIREDLTEMIKTTVAKSETSICQELYNQVDRLESEQKASENRIIATINREVNDLAEINRLALNKLDNHEIRLTKIEKKLAIP